MEWNGTPEELGDYARRRMDYIWQSRLRKAYPLIQAATPRIVFNNRLTVTAGRAFTTLTPQYIDLSNQLLWQYPQEFHDTIIPHEAAHLAAYARYGDNGHGADWKRVMAYLGLPADRCHEMVNHYRTK